NPDHSVEIFLYYSVTGTTSQLTNSVGIYNFNPFISGDGTKIAFLSNGNDQAGNPDGSTEILLYPMQRASISSFTFFTFRNGLELIDKPGSTISFYAADNYTG